MNDDDEILQKSTHELINLFEQYVSLATQRELQGNPKRNLHLIETRVEFIRNELFRRTE